ncbi:MAG: hypothetical protein GF353_16385 [Candidatus Lokiarchaeota archaeon]|nr:hypothetical protein [Candidatus Lokiarchaeota archaeon]
MIAIDIIIPTLIEVENLKKFEISSFPSWTGNWFPIWYNNKRLKKNGLKIRFFNLYNINLNNLSNIIGIDNKIIYDLETIYGRTNILDKKNKLLLSFIKKLNSKGKKLLYFDNKDGTDIQQQFLPYINLYLKKQLLKNRSLYNKKVYLKRLFTEFYAQNYEVDISDEFQYSFDSFSEYNDIIKLSWNFALKDYRYSNEFSRFLCGLTRKINIDFQKPGLDRRYLLSANFSVKSFNELLYFQRKELLKFLKSNYKSRPDISLGRIPKKEYINVVNNSLAILSPFGWGEICYRDFETFIAGAALIKPDMEHIETWPDFYLKNESYLSISWEIEKWSTEIPNILSNKKKLYRTGVRGQNLYKKLWSEKGQTNFCVRFKNLIQDL